MEKTEPVEGLAASREQLSLLLIGRPHAATNIDDDTFPRSKLMRFLFDPRKRGVWVAGATTAAVLFPTLSGAGKLGALAALAGRVTRIIYRGRH